MKLSIIKPQLKIKQQASIIATTRIVLLWHNRLIHTNYESIQATTLKQFENSTNIDNCKHETLLKHAEKLELPASDTQKRLNED